MNWTVAIAVFLLGYGTMPYATNGLQARSNRLFTYVVIPLAALMLGHVVGR